MESAKTPGIELDAAVALAFGWTIYDDGMGVMQRWRDPDSKIGAGLPPPFTTSLDAGLALAERMRPGEWWTLLYGAIMDWRAHVKPEMSLLPLAFIRALLRTQS